MASRQLVVVLWLGLMAGGPVRSATSEDTRPPNILFLFTDDHRRSRFNFLPEGRTSAGEPRNLTPTLDKLAREGIVLSSMYASSTVCTPSRFSVLTGRYASRSTARAFVTQTATFGQANVQFNTHIGPDTPNLAKTLQKAGYLTGGVGKNHVISAERVRGIPPTRTPGIRPCGPPCLPNIVPRSKGTRHPSATRPGLSRIGGGRRKH